MTGSNAHIDEAALLEAGLVVAALAIVGAVLALAGGRLVGDISAGRRHGRKAPEAGSVPAERHRHVASMAAR